MGSDEHDSRDSTATPERPGALRFRERSADIPVVDKYVAVAVLIQLVGYAALSALIPHSDYSSFVEPLQHVPVLLLIPLAIVAVPALVIALILGGVLSLVGVQPTNILVLISIYLVGVVSVWGYRSRDSSGDT